MPVRLLSSFVLKWPDLQTVEDALRPWVAQMVKTRPEVMRVGYFGSYARGDWGPGSDVDIVIVVTDSDEPFHKRASRWDVTELPVPAQVLVYTKTEWDNLNRRGRFCREVMREAIWVYPA